MPDSKATQVLTAAREALAQPFDFDAFLAKLVPKDKVSAARRVSVLETATGADGANLWKRLACTLMKLSVHAAKLVGQQTVQFYVAEGKHRMQVFALEDLQDGSLTVYCPDILDQATTAGLLAHAPAAADTCTIASSGESIHIEPLNGSSLNPAPHVKDLTGWNRKALRITLPPSASSAQIDAAEVLCAIAAQRFTPAA